MGDCVAQTKPLFFSPLLLVKKAFLKTTIIKTALLRRANDESTEENSSSHHAQNAFETGEGSGDCWGTGDWGTGAWDSWTRSEKRSQYRRSYLRFWEGARRRHIDARIQWRDKLNRHLLP